MTDATTTALASYATSFGWNDLTEAAIGAVKMRILDSIGCAAGGFGAEPCRIARVLAADVTARHPARVWFTPLSTAPDMAAFANAAMVRYLDWNDTMTLLGSGHPSDMIPVLVAAAEASGRSGRDLILAIASAYEAFAALARMLSIRERGWDQGLFIGVSAAVGLARLFGLSHAETCDALALTITPCVPTRQTRAGELSMWKACATAASTRAALFAVSLAQAGMTGPDRPFEGRHGIFELVTGPFVLPAFADRAHPFAVELSHIKSFPSEFHSQAPIWLALDLRRQLCTEEIARIDIQTYWIGYSEIGAEAEKWHPKTRETADHSLPFLVATALRHGTVGMESFTDARIADPDLIALMAKIHITEDKFFTARYPGELLSRIEITTASGRRITEETSYPRGHARNPLSEAELAAKFARAANGLLSDAATQRIADAVQGLDALGQVGEFTVVLAASA